MSGKLSTQMLLFRHILLVYYCGYCPKLVSMRCDNIRLFDIYIEGHRRSGKTSMNESDLKLLIQ